MNHPSLQGWDISNSETTDWVPWGSSNNARAKVLATGDGFYVALVEASAGYKGDPHEHVHPEFLYVVEGVIRNQGRTMVAGDGYAAAAGSCHTDFAAESDATYLSIFKL
jgi:quercetin dioxygenase-like cupin family protein